MQKLFAPFKTFDMPTQAKPNEISKTGNLTNIRNSAPSKKQRALAGIWLQNELNNSGLSMGEMVRRAGYALNTADQYAKRTITKPGTQTAIMDIAKEMKASLMERGINSDYLANKLHLMLEGRFEKDVNFRAINYGLEHAFKLGIGGGYAPEKTQNLNLNVTMTPEELKKYKPLKDEYEEKLRQQELDQNEN